jgi:hypothetical protein
MSSNPLSHLPETLTFPREVLILKEMNSALLQNKDRPLDDIGPPKITDKRTSLLWDQASAG